MSQTHSLAEWASVLSLGIGVHASFSVPYFLLVDAALRDFDPRPAMRRSLESGRFDSALVTVANAKYDGRELAASAVLYARLSLRDAAFTAAALLALLTIAPGDAR